MIICPHCNEYTEPGSFCQECGKPLEYTNVDEGSTNPHPTRNEKPSRIEGDEFPEICEDIGEESVVSGVSLDEALIGMDDEDEESDCKEFAIEYLPQTCICGISSSFDFRIKGRDRKNSHFARNIELSIKSDFLERSSSDSCLSGPKKGRSKELNLNIRPSDAGMKVTLLIEFQYELEGNLYRYAGKIKTDIISLDHYHSRSGSTNINIGQIHTSYASEAHLNIPIGQQERLDHELLEEIRKQNRKAAWTRILLEGESRPFVEGKSGKLFSQKQCETFPQRPSNLPKRVIMLENSDHRILFLSGSQITLGRDRTRSDLVVRTFNHRGAELNRAKTMSVSGLHLVLLMQNDRFCIKDVSTNGTLLDGKPLRRDVEVKLHSERQYRCLLGSANPGGLGTEFVIKVLGHGLLSSDLCESCSIRGNGFGGETAKAGALLIERTDGVPETYIFVNKCVDLDRILGKPQLKACISVHGENFLVSASDGKAWVEAELELKQILGESWRSRTPWQLIEGGIHLLP